MSHDTVAPRAVPHRHTSAAGRLAELTAVLGADLDQGHWAPGPLERALAGRLLVACAGDGQFTPVRLRETLWEGSVALTYAGGGRLTRLLSALHEEAAHPAPGDDRDHAAAGAARLLERVAAGIPSQDGDGF
ncbi:hypothetical protein SAMN06272735_8811 [Streptomyces sp. TLI_55]|uniref:hypothetical protein n=1 Tax=Streptomyces sp. TLI_55 TaxID=1938861 RepID=UPI000BCBBAC0|nr:hypothetical protein [Streptomyces sp. TLI_55]SNX88367.1 hypothetical protein SAMN06272735_8811 [Streptomyces sp. TLI_55]